MSHQVELIETTQVESDEIGYVRFNTFILVNGEKAIIDTLIGDPYLPEELEEAIQTEIDRLQVEGLE